MRSAASLPRVTRADRGQDRGRWRRRHDLSLLCGANQTTSRVVNDIASLTSGIISCRDVNQDFRRHEAVRPSVESAAVRPSGKSRGQNGDRRRPREKAAVRSAGATYRPQRELWVFVLGVVGALVVGWLAGRALAPADVDIGVNSGPHLRVSGGR